jgi:hypothetical protein
MTKIVKMVSDGWDIPDFLKREKGESSKFRRRRVKAPAMPKKKKAKLPKDWRGADLALMNCYPPTFPESFPPGLRLVWYKPGRGCMRVREMVWEPASEGAMARISKRDFDRAMIEEVS